MSTTTDTAQQSAQLKRDVNLVAACLVRSEVAGMDLDHRRIPVKVRTAMGRQLREDSREAWRAFQRIRAALGPEGNL